MVGKFSILPIIAGILLVITAQVPQAKSQTSLGTVTNVTSITCPTDRGFLTSGISCSQATLHACPYDADVDFIFGVAAPSRPTPLGTIVFLAGDGGVAASDGTHELDLLARYVTAGYQVVQIAWGPGSTGQDWEETGISGAPSILLGACRPATFLNWVRNGNPPGVGAGLWAGNGGMCAQGHSGGSGAIAYALTWYNAGALTVANGQGYLDKVTLDSGPVFSDIQQGCEVNTSNQNTQFTTLCSTTSQTGCKGWAVSEPPGSSLEYTTGYKTEVNQWSGNNTAYACANNSHYTTYDWSNMSILSPAQYGQTPSFSYPKTTMSAYLCESVGPGVTPNNVTAQGQLYYAQFTSQTQAGSQLSVYAVTGCPTTEGIYEPVHMAPNNLGPFVPYNGNDWASDDMFNDMTSGSQACLANHLH